MQPERQIPRREFSHWRAISRTRGKACRLIREPTLEWRRVARQRKKLREKEKRARRAVRAYRLDAALELCLVALARSKIWHAAEVGRWLDAPQPARIPVADHLDHLLEEEENVYKRVDERGKRNRRNATLNSKQLRVRGKWVTLSQHEVLGLVALKRFHWLLSRFRDSKTESDSLDTAIYPRHSPMAESPIDRLEDHLKHSGVIGARVDTENPSTYPSVHLLDLILLSDEVQCTLAKFKQSNPDLSRHLIQQHYISAGLEDGAMSAQQVVPGHAPAHKFLTRHGADSAIGRQVDAHIVPSESDPSALDNAADVGEGQLVARCLHEISETRNNNHCAANKDKTGEVSFMDVLATTAKTNLSVMKMDVDKALNNSQSSQAHLLNYREFIERKKRQRTQCLRDLQTHCCRCRGAHIAKPPFSHGKEYRREPLHSQHQGVKCLFLKRKRAELKWLDETIANYSTNNDRFEHEIDRRAAETLSRKENMKDALANSLRLMEMASNAL